MNCQIFNTFTLLGSVVDHCVFSCRHNTTWLWRVRRIQTRYSTRSSPSCRRKRSTSHRKGESTNLVSVNLYFPLIFLPEDSLFKSLCLIALHSDIPSSVRPGATTGRWRWRLSWRCACCRGLRWWGSAARGWRETLGSTSTWLRTSSPHPGFKSTFQLLSSSIGWLLSVSSDPSES